MPFIITVKTCLIQFLCPYAKNYPLTTDYPLPHLLMSLFMYPSDCFMPSSFSGYPLSDIQFSATLTPIIYSHPYGKRRHYRHPY